MDELLVVDRGNRPAARHAVESPAPAQEEAQQDGGNRPHNHQGSDADEQAAEMCIRDRP